MNVHEHHFMMIIYRVLVRIFQSGQEEEHDEDILYEKGEKCTLKTMKIVNSKV